MNYDGRGGAKCFPARVPPREICEVSFIRLAARTEEYDRRMISVIGHLRRESGEDRGGGYWLYLDRSAREHGPWVNGVELVLTAEQESALEASAAREGIDATNVIGTFSAYRNINGWQIGVIDVDAIKLRAFD